MMRRTKQERMMKTENRSRELQALKNRRAPLDMPPEEFRRLGHRLIDEIGGFLETLPSRPVTPAEPGDLIRELIDSGRGMPERGAEAGPLLERAAELLFEHSLFNGHPRFLGYITSSAAPLGALADLLAASVNPNVGGWKLAPIATEIEVQTIRWVAELLGYPANCGGLLVSGGNMANFVGFLAGRKAKIPWDIRKSGMGQGADRLRVYASTEVHTWIQKAADLFGLGTDAIAWIETDDRQRLDAARLQRKIEEDLKEDVRPLIVVGSAGTVSTGAVDPLEEMAAICREHDLWFHVDGAYGAVAALVEGAPPEIKGLSQADSVAVDPHKWLYAPLEAGCALVRDAEKLLDAFSYHPPYYHLEEEELNYFDYGPQNSRGFRALKVWLALQNVGREGYRRMIADDILLAEEFYGSLKDYPELEAMTQNLSVAAFRYVPADLRPGSPEVDDYLDDLNREILRRLEKGGEVFVSNAVIGGRFCLRICVVNFRTSLADIQALPSILTRVGREADAELRPK
jgi:aromatic-L-amino-acid/L-tryptophan decarboxylase